MLSSNVIVEVSLDPISRTVATVAYRAGLSAALRLVQRSAAGYLASSTGGGALHLGARIVAAPVMGPFAIALGVATMGWLGMKAYKALTH